MELDYRLHAQIGIKSKEVPSLKLWYLCRAYDQKGAGKVTIDSDVIMKEIGCSRTTLWRYLKDERVVRSYQLKEGVLTIYYCSIKKLCMELGISNLGAIGNVDTVHDIYHNSILITALWLQGLSQTLAKRENSLSSQAKKRKGGPNVKTRYKYHNSILKYFDNEGKPLSSYMCRGAMVGTSSRNTVGLMGVIRAFENHQGITNYILSHNVLPYGACYEGIARKLRITTKTVGEHLRKESRVRIIIRPTGHYCSKAEFLATEDIIGRNPTNGYYYDHKGRFMKYHTNLYYPSIPLSTQAQLRGKVHKYVSNNSNVSKEEVWVEPTRNEGEDY